MGFVSTFDIFGQEAVPDPARIRALRDEILTLRTQIKRQADQGLPPDEIDGARGLIAAADTAEAVVGFLADKSMKGALS
jgi:hypothetical protein